MKRKGISLPVEMIVIIAIAVLVLVVIAAFFAGGFGPPTNTIVAQAAFSQGCNTWKIRSSDCSMNPNQITISSYNPDGKANSGDENLAKACQVLGYPLQSDCARACGCPTSSASGGP
jgi:hypothetical protein